MCEPRTYTAAKECNWNGLTFRISSPYHTKEDRWRRNIYLLGLDGKPLPGMPKQLSTPVGASEEDLEQLTESRLPLIAAEYAITLIEQAKSLPGATMTLETYVALNKIDIQLDRRWAGKSNKYWDIWQKDLCKQFGSLSIADCNSFTVFDERMEELTHRKQHKVGLTDEERTYWVILGGILQYACNIDHLFEENPLKSIAAQCREKLSTIASKDLARQSLSRDELIKFLKVCHENSSHSDVHSAMILQVLTGLTVEELCGLNIGDWKKHSDVYRLEVLRQYEQSRGAVPLLNNVLDSGNAYRQIPCTSVVNYILERQVSLLSSRGFRQHDAPLFLDATGKVRLSPQEYKQILHEVLDPIIHDGPRLYFVERNSFLKGENRPSIFHGDFLRGTAEYYFRNTCKMTASEIAVMLGVDRRHTFAISYVDWGNKEVLMYLREKIHRWHADLIHIPEANSAVALPQTRRGFLTIGAVSPETTIRIHAPTGVDGVLEPCA